MSNPTTREKAEVVLEEYYGTDAHCEEPWLVHRRDCADLILAIVEEDTRERESALAATQCLHDMRGDDYGNAMCPLEADRSRLLALLRQSVSALECYEQGYTWSPREASILAACRAVLDGETGKEVV